MSANRMPAKTLAFTLLACWLAVGCQKRSAEGAADTAAVPPTPAPAVAPAADDAAKPSVAVEATATAATALDAAKKGPLVPVTTENFARAETDLYFGNAAMKDGALGKFKHHRELMGIDDQFVVRGNRDTLYSIAVFDLDAGPVTITMPDPGDRYQALQVIDQDEYVPNVFYGKGARTLTREGVGTRYVAAGVRTLVDPNDPADVQAVHALQDAIQVKQDNVGTFEIPNWDPVSQKQIREALLTLSASLPDTRNAFGPRGKVEPVRHLITSASAWGGNPDKDALYLNVTPQKNDGNTVYRLAVRDVPVDGFWSISVYNAKGYYEKNPHNAYTLNNLTAKKNEDGSIKVQFGGCDGQIPNCLPITAGWNYMVRLYRARPEILDGRWAFPEAQPAG